ncbi:MAG TPA: hypothetical protein VMW41_04125 [Candidatus Bathyarchaeia archaeon]|nr:hypothetical protein [Candidatus Bathyarchaeia archaeon]
MSKFISCLKKSYTYAFGKIDELFEELVHSRAAFTIILLLIGISILRIFLIALTHDPNFDFDESNTIRIAQQTPANINRILSVEQNLPLYYQILHLLFKIFNGQVRSAIWFNFIVWLFSIFIFYRILLFFFPKRRFNYFFLLIYILTPNIFYYAFYLRMYGLCNLFFLIFLFFLFKFFNKEKILWLIILGFCLIILSLLHPSALGVMLLLLFLSYWIFTDRRSFLIFILFLSFSLALIFYQLSQKTDLKRIYFTRGIEYLRDKNIFFYEFPGLLFFFGNKWELEALGLRGVWILFFYLLSFFLLCHFFLKRSLFARKEIFTVFIFVAIFYLLSLGVSHFASRHLIFFIPPILISIFLGLTSLSKNQVKYFALLLLFFFMTQNSRWVKLLVSRHFYYQRLCRHLASLSSGLIITDITYFNVVENCLNLENFPTLLLDVDGLTDIANLDELSVLIIQAEKGGKMFDINSRNQSYIERLGNLLNSQEKLKIRAVLKNAIADRKSVYLVYNHENNLPHAKEMELIGSDFRFQKLACPGIFEFAKISR